jgi:hypothetical protein
MGRVTRRDARIASLGHVNDRWAVVDAGDDDPRVQGTRRLFDAIAAEPRVTATAIQTVGSKGYDGFVIALVADQA